MPSVGTTAARSMPAPRLTKWVPTRWPVTTSPGPTTSVPRPCCDRTSPSPRSSSSVVVTVLRLTAQERGEVALGREAGAVGRARRRRWRCAGACARRRARVPWPLGRPVAEQPGEALVADELRPLARRLDWSTWSQSCPIGPCGARPIGATIAPCSLPGAPPAAPRCCSARAGSSRSSAGPTGLRAVLRCHCGTLIVWSADARQRRPPSAASRPAAQPPMVIDALGAVGGHLGDGGRHEARQVEGAVVGERQVVERGALVTVWTTFEVLASTSMAMTSPVMLASTYGLPSASVAPAATPGRSSTIGSTVLSPVASSLTGTIVIATAEPGLAEAAGGGDDGAVRGDPEGVDVGEAAAQRLG